MPRKTKTNAQKTRDTILDAAAMVFAREGVAGASLDEIARTAGVTRGAVYWHFTNKTDIFQALYNQLYVPFTTAILAGLSTDHPAPLRQLETLCTDQLLELVDQPQKRRIIEILFLKCDYSGEFHLFLEQQNQQTREGLEIFEQYFIRARHLGHLSASQDPKTLTLALLCFISGIAFNYVRSGSTLDLKVQAMPMMRVFFTGLQ